MAHQPSDNTGAEPAEGQSAITGTWKESFSAENLDRALDRAASDRQKAGTSLFRWLVVAALVVIAAALVGLL